MTQVSTTTPPTTTTTTTAPVSATFNESLSQVLTKLSGQKVKTTQLEGAKFNETVLYAAHVLDQLKKTSPDLAKTFLSELKTRYDRRIQRNDTNPIGKAINDILDNGVKKKQISASQYNRIMSNALGKSQLDSKKSDVSVNLHKGGMEAINSKTQANTKATSAQLKEYEKTVSTLKFQSKKTTQAQQKRMSDLFESLKTKKTETPPTTTPPATPTTTTPPKNDETSVPVEKNDPTKNTSPESFDFRPQSETDGKLMIRIPASWSKEAVKVELISKDGEVLDTSIDNMRGTDGRRQYRFGKAGNNYETLTEVRVQLTDGTFMRQIVENPSSPFSRSFMG